MENELKSNPYSQYEESSDDASIPTGTLQIYDFIASYLARGKDTHVNRASSASMCPKRRWFQGRGEVGEPTTPRKMVNFLLGNLSETTLNFFVKNGCVGPGKLYSEVTFGEVIGSFEFQGKKIEIYKQEDLTADIGGIEVTAHVDGWGKRNLDGKWELIEFKSASDYGFSDFKEEGPGSYLKQSTVNLMTGKARELGATEVRYFYLKKQTGHLYDRSFAFDPVLASEVMNDYKIAIGEPEPLSPYSATEETYYKKPTGRKILPFPCSYCPYKSKCFRYTKEFKKSGSPVFVVN